MNDEIKTLKNQLSESKKFNEVLLKELAIMKLFLSKKLNFSLDSMSYNQTLKESKIVDNIKVYLNDDEYSLLDSRFCFDISFDIKNLNDEKLAWNVYFIEEGKEEVSELLKTVFIKNKAGSVNIKITVSRLDSGASNLKLDSENSKNADERLIENGCSIYLKCSLNENTLYEVRYYFSVMKIEDTGSMEKQLSKLKLTDSTKSSQSLKSNNIQTLVRRIIKKTESENPSNCTIETELNSDTDFK